MIEAIAWTAVQLGVVLLVSSLVFDGLHWALHRWATSRWRLLRWAAGLHAVHHRFLDKKMQVHLELRRANILAHVLPEFGVACLVTGAFALIWPLAVALALARHVGMLAYVLWTEGVDAHHMAMERLDGQQPRLRVNASYHARHHVHPGAYYGSVWTIFDRLFGTGLELRGARVVVLGGNGALGVAFMRELAKRGARVETLGHEGLPAEPETVDLLVLASGSRGIDAWTANYARPISVAEHIMEVGRNRLVPMEVWGVGSETEIFGSDEYACSKRAFARYAARNWTHERGMTYRHLVPGAFNSALGPGVMSADFVARVAIGLAKRGFAYMPIGALALANWPVWVWRSHHAVVAG